MDVDGGGCQSAGQAAFRRSPIEPRLIYSDFWSGNLGQDEETAHLIFFDAGSFYAYNILELSMWRR